MKAKIISLVAVLLSAVFANAQDASEWSQYKYRSLFSIGIPPTLELRDPDSAMGQCFETMSEYLSGDADKGKVATFWPGVSSMDKYARIIVRVKPQLGIYQKDMASLTEQDMQSLNDVCGAAAVIVMKQRGMDIEWLGTRKEIYDGKYVFHRAYRRTGLEGPVRVDQYLTWYRLREIDIVISYRESEASYWQEDLEAVIKSLRF